LKNKRPAEVLGTPRQAGGAVAAAASPTTGQAINTPGVTDDFLRVGSLELDLINRTARRGDRSFYLRPCECRLLKYMMQRCGQLLPRAKLLEDVWNYKFVPETTILVDVHMGKLRRKVDGSNEAPMIRNVRGAGFILPSGWWKAPRGSASSPRPDLSA
jgi:DNA-binding response OmpR family regulator